MYTPQHNVEQGFVAAPKRQQRLPNWAMSVVTVLGCVALLAGCNSDVSSTSTTSIGSASADQSISQQEALTLVQSQSETGEPSSITTLSLQGSETNEPFGL